MCVQIQMELLMVYMEKKKIFWQLTEEVPSTFKKAGRGWEERTINFAFEAQLST